LGNLWNLYSHFTPCSWEKRGFSASSEEMSAQVEEVNAAAQSLAEMASTLQRIVAEFRLNEKGGL